MTTLQEISAGIQHTDELMDLLFGVFNQMHACTTKEELYLITRDENLIAGALEYATGLESAHLLLSCLDIEIERNRELLLNVLPRVESLAIAELIIDKFNANDITIDFTELPKLVPYYGTELDLELVTYFIRHGGSAHYFNCDYLEALCDHDTSLRAVLQPHIEAQRIIESEIEENAERRIIENERRDPNFDTE